METGVEKAGDQHPNARSEHTEVQIIERTRIVSGSKIEARHCVVEAFAHRESAKSGAFASDGHYLWTYAKIIAVWDDDQVHWCINIARPPRWSQTSTEHINFALAWMNDKLHDANQQYTRKQTNIDISG